MTVNGNYYKEVKVIKAEELEPFFEDLQKILSDKNINKEQLAILTNLDIECISPLYSNTMDLNLEVLNKIIESLNLKVVIQLQIEDL